MTDVQKRLEYLRSQIEAESISYGEIIELQSLAEFIEPGDVQLLEWAGVPEHSEETEEHNVYWDTELEDDDARPYDDDTARIIDLNLGGVIAYCSRVNAHRIVMALRAAEEG